MIIVTGSAHVGADAIDEALRISVPALPGSFTPSRIRSRLECAGQASSGSGSTAAMPCGVVVSLSVAKTAGVQEKHAHPAASNSANNAFPSAETNASGVKKTAAGRAPLRQASASRRTPSTSNWPAAWRPLRVASLRASLMR